MGLEIVYGLFLPEQIEIENMVTKICVHGEPVSRNHPYSYAHVQGEPIVTCKLRTPYAADQVDHLEFTGSVWRSAEARLDGRDFPLPGQLS